MAKRYERSDATNRMDGRVCLVTGATDGHGKAAALALALRGAEVVLMGRSSEKLRAVQGEIAEANHGKAPDTLRADLSKPDEIDAAVETYRASGRPLHVLVNNAGLVSLDRQTTDEGYELTFAVNYLAMVRLTLGLLPLLESSSPARIVNISSDTYRIATLDFDDLQLERNYGIMRAYGQSKLAILTFTLELARRTPGSGVVVNAVDPGPIASNIGANNPGTLYRVARPLIRGLFPSAARAARTAVDVATEASLESANGGYYRSRKQREEPLEFNAATSIRLWDETLRLLRLPKESGPAPDSAIKI